MKEVQITNVKVKIFEDGEVIQKLGLTQKRKWYCYEILNRFSRVVVRWLRRVCY